MSVSPSTVATDLPGHWSWARKLPVRSLTFGLTANHRFLSRSRSLAHAALRQHQKHGGQVAVRSPRLPLSAITRPFSPVRQRCRFLSTRCFLPRARLAIGLPLAVLLAWLVERTAIPARAWIGNLILVPMTVPSLLSAIAWVQLLDPRNGLVNVVLRGLFGLQSRYRALSTSTRSRECVLCRVSGWCRRRT